MGNYWYEKREKAKEKDREVTEKDRGLKSDVCGQSGKIERWSKSERGRRKKN